MNDLVTLQKTIALYCRDLLEELEMYDQLRFDGRGFARAVDAAVGGDYDVSLVMDLHRHLEGAAAGIMSVYSRAPGLARFEQFYARVQSLMEMCRNLYDHNGPERR
jgi:hypothetical protein